VTIGYAVMRVGLVAMWWRAAREHPERRRTAMRYVVGILAVQAVWLARLALPAGWMLPSFALLALVELAIPVWAAKAGHTPWHAHHIAERYGLFTIIVLGECVLSASSAVGGAIASRGWSLDVALVGLGSASLILALWWVYFLQPWADALHHHRDRAFRWGYGHFPIFASLAALGAFLGVVADQLKPVQPDMHAVSPTLAVGLVASAVALYLSATWSLGAQVARQQARLAGPWLGAMAVLAGVVAAVAAGLPLPWALPLLTLAPGLIVAVVEFGQRRAPHRFTPG
jgi:low temperature requirement protein LtrA